LQIIFFAHQDEVIALQDKVIIRGSDLLTWLVDESEWDWGFVSPASGDPNSSAPPSTQLTKAFLSDKFLKTEKVIELRDTGKGPLTFRN